MRFVTALRASTSLVLRALAPPRCAACDAPSELDGFCERCCENLTRFREPLAVQALPLYAGVAFDAAVRAALHRFKYLDRPDLAGALARLTLPLFERAPLPKGALWIPVPLHPTRLALRGYNQSALLCRCWSRAQGGRVLPLALRRTADTSRQTALSRAERLRNVAGAFEVRQPRALQGARVILVDDVVTTGATVSNCARALHTAGASIEGVVAVAARRHDPAPGSGVEAVSP